MGPAFYCRVFFFPYPEGRHGHHRKAQRIEHPGVLLVRSRQLEKQGCAIYSPTERESIRRFYILCSRSSRVFIMMLKSALKSS